MRRRFVVSMGALVLCLAGSASADGQHEQKEGAQKTFEAGSSLYDGKHFEQALTAFRASYEIVPSPNSHLMVARCLRELGRNVEAYRELDAVAAEAAAKGERYESARHAAEEERDEVKQRIAFVTVRVVDPPAGVTVKLGDKALDPGALGTAVPMDPGTVTVIAEAPGFVPSRRDVVLEAGGAPEVALTLVAEAAATPAAPAPAGVAAPPPAPSRSSGSLRPWAYVSGGVGVAGLATFAIFGAMSSSKYTSLKSSCPDGHCPPNLRDDIDAGSRDQTIANVGLALGVVGLGVGTTLFFLSSPSKSEASARGATVRVRVGTGSIAVDGAF